MEPRLPSPNSEKEWELDVDRETLLMIGVVAGVAIGLGVPAWLAVLAYRGIQSSAQRRLQIILGEVTTPPSTSNEPQVEVLCYAYYGLIASLTTVKIQCRLPINQANDLLDKVHRFNLRWGWFAAAGLFVPIASTIRTWQQRRSFREQLEAFEKSK
jgi:hypothetical protein